MAIYLLLVSPMGCVGRNPLLKRGPLEGPPYPMGIGPVGNPVLEESHGDGVVSHFERELTQSMGCLFLY